MDGYIAIHSIIFPTGNRPFSCFPYGKMRMPTAAFRRIFLIVVFYWLVSITTVFINKALLSGDTFSLDAPVFVTWFQCLFSTVYYSIYGCLIKHQIPSIVSAKPVKNVLPLSFVFACMIIFNNLCLKHVDVSFYYVGRSLTTVFNVILTYIVLRKATSKAVCCCCLVIVFGFWLGIDQEQFIGTLSIPGTIFGILGSFSLALYSINVKKVLPNVDEIVWILSYYNNAYSTLLLLPFVTFELPRISAYNGLNDISFWCLMLVSGACGLAIGYATALQIQATSPLTHNVSGTAKACAQTVLAAFYYEQAGKTIAWWLSNFIVLAGSASYTAVRQHEIERATTLVK